MGSGPGPAPTVARWQAVETGLAVVTERMVSR